MAGTQSGTFASCSPDDLTRRRFLPKTFQPFASSPPAVDTGAPARPHGPTVTSALLQYQLDLDRRRAPPSLHDEAVFMFEATTAGRVYELVDAGLSIAFGVLYIWNTRYARVEDRYQALPLWSKVLERMLAITIFVMYLPRYYLYHRPVSFFFKPFSLATWLSTVSVFVAWVIDDTALGPDIDLTYMSAGDMVFLYPARFARISFAVQETLRPMKTVMLQLSPISRQVAMLGNTVLSAILTISAILHIVAYKLATYQDQDPPSSTFFDTFFFTTVGTVTGMRSTEVPDTRFTRLVNLVVIALGFLWLPKKLTHLIQLVNSQSPYDRAPPRLSNPSETYVVISGEPEVSESHLADFLHEFLHVDHGVIQSTNLRATILRPAVPGQVLQHVLGDPSLSSRVSYVAGTVTSFTSLNKIGAGTAKAAFLLASRTGNEDEDEADAKQMMRALSLRKFNNDIRIFVEVHLRENVANFDFLAESVVCKQDLLDGLIAQSVLVPGLASVLLTLSTSISDSTISNLTVEAKKRGMPWMAEYLNSLSQEFYTSSLHASFLGLRFLEVVEIVYRHIGVLVVGYGLDSETHTRRSTVRFAVDPDHVIHENEVCVVIAPDVYNADRVAQFDASQAGPRHYSDFGSDGLFTPADIPASQPSTGTASIELSDIDGPVLTVTDSDGLAHARRLSASSAESAEMTVQPLVVPVPLTRSHSPGRSSLQTRDASAAREESPVRHDRAGGTQFEDHFLICDCSDATSRRFETLLSSVRNSPDPDVNQRAVVILTKNPPAERGSRSRGQAWKDVFYLAGNPTDRDDLERAGVAHAARCLVLSDANHAHNSPTTQTADARALLAGLNFESMNQRTDSTVVIECLHQDTIKLVGQTRTIDCDDNHVKPYLRPSFMAGNIVCPGQVDALTSQCFYNPFMLEFFQAFLFPRTGGAHVALVPVPPQLHGRPYGSLVSFVFSGKLARHDGTSRHGIPLGLRRHQSVSRGPKLSYAAINPAPHLELKKGDAVYVLRYLR